MSTTKKIIKSTIKSNKSTNREAKQSINDSVMTSHLLGGSETYTNRSGLSSSNSNCGFNYNYSTSQYQKGNLSEGVAFQPNQYQISTNSNISINDRAVEVKCAASNMTMKIKGDSQLQCAINNNDSKLQEILEIALSAEYDKIVGAKSNELNAMKAKYESVNSLLQQTNNYVGNLKSQLSEAFNSLANYEAELKGLRIEKSQLTDQLESMTIKTERKMKEITSAMEEELTHLDRRTKELVKENSELLEQLHFFEEKNQDTVSQYSMIDTEIARLNKIINVYEINFNEVEEKLKDKQLRLEQMQQDLNKERTSNLESTLKIKSLNDDNNHLSKLNDSLEAQNREMNEYINKFEESNSKNNHSKIEAFEQSCNEKFTAKIQAYEKSIKDQQIVIQSLDQEVVYYSEQLNISKDMVSKTMNKMQEELIAIKSDYDKKSQQQLSNYNNDVLKIKQEFEIECLKLLQTHKIEKEELIKEIQATSIKLKSIDYIDKDYIKLDAHNEKLNNTVYELQQKHQLELKDRERKHEESYKQKLSKLESEKGLEFEFLVENYKKQINNLEKRNFELETINVSLNRKQELSQEASSTLEKKLGVVSEFEKLYKNEKDKTQSLKSEVDKLDESIKQYRSELWGREEKNAELTITNKMLETENFKHQRVIEDLKLHIDILSKQISKMKDEKDETIKIKYTEQSMSQDDLFKLKEQLHDAKAMLNLEKDKYSVLTEKYSLVKSHEKMHQEKIQVFQSAVSKLKSKLLNIKVALNKAKDELKTVYTDHKAEVVKTKQYFTEKITEIEKFFLGLMKSALGKTKEEARQIEKDIFAHYEEKMNQFKSTFINHEDSKKSEIQNMQNELSKMTLQNDKTYQSYKRAIADFSNLKAELDQVKQELIDERSNSQLLSNEYEDHLHALINTTRSLKQSYEKELSVIKSKLIEVESLQENSFYELRTERENLTKRDQENRSKLEEVSANMRVYESKYFKENEITQALRNQIELINGRLNEEIAKRKDLASHLEQKSSEISYLRDRYDKLLDCNSKNNSEIQKLVNKSISCYDKNNLSVSKKLDEEIKSILSRLKQEKDND